MENELKWIMRIIVWILSKCQCISAYIMSWQAIFARSTLDLVEHSLIWTQQYRSKPIPPPAYTVICMKWIVNFTMKVCMFKKQATYVDIIIIIWSNFNFLSCSTRKCISHGNIWWWQSIKCKNRIFLYQPITWDQPSIAYNSSRGRDSYNQIMEYTKSKMN